MPVPFDAGPFSFSQDRNLEFRGSKGLDEERVSSNNRTKNMRIDRYDEHMHTITHETAVRRLFHRAQVVPARKIGKVYVDAILCHNVSLHRCSMEEDIPSLSRGPNYYAGQPSIIPCVHMASRTTDMWLNLNMSVASNGFTTLMMP